MPLRQDLARVDLLQVKAGICGLSMPAPIQEN
jgi:hypothetical protein